MKSREGKYPAPQALAELLYHWMRTWPHARIDKSVTDRLYPYIVEKWREGWSLTEIAQTAVLATTAEPSRRARWRLSPCREDW